MPIILSNYMSKNNEIYDKDYFENYYDKFSGTKVYDRENFLDFFKYISNEIFKKIRPKTVLDAGCAKGFLVECLRDLGIEAYGVDISKYAVSNARDDIKPYLSVGSITESFQRNYDLIVCFEVLEHLSHEESKKAIKNMCTHANTIFFSSTPSDPNEPTHINMKSPGDWAKIFAENGFMQEANFDVSFVSSQAMLFKKVKKNLPDLISNFSDAVYQIRNFYDQEIIKRDTEITKRDTEITKRDTEITKRDTEITQLNTKITKRDNLIEKQNQEIKRRILQINLLLNKINYYDNFFSELNNSIGYKMLRKIINMLDSKFPLNTKRRKILDRIISNFIKIMAKKSEINPNLNLDTHITKFSNLSFFEQYQLWLKNHSLKENDFQMMRKQINSFKIKPKISIIMPVFNTDEQWLRCAINSVKNQIYENWELCICDDGSTESQVKETLEEFKTTDDRIKIHYSIENQGISIASNNAIKLAGGEYVGFLDHDDELYPDALFEIVNRINKKPDTDIIYSDEDKIDQKGIRNSPYFKPDWSPELLSNGNYITHFCVYKNNVIEELKGFRDYSGSQDYDLILRATDKERKIEHISKILYGWRQIPGSAALSTSSKPYAYNVAIIALEDKIKRNGYDGKVQQITDTFFYRTKYEYGNPTVSIIIPVLEDLEILKRCILSIKKNTTHKSYEIIIVDHLHKKKELESILGNNCTIIKFDEKYQNSKVYNSGARVANGEYLLFLDPNLEIITNNWIESMLEVGFISKVGAVGCLLFNNNGKIYHAGKILGLDGICSNALEGRKHDNMYFGIANAIRNCSAVSGKCILIKKNVFDSIHGWDENLSQYFNDVDLCLRIYESGYRVAYTPYVKLQMQNQITDDFSNEIDQRKLFIKKWKHVLEKPDPYYNENLSHVNGGYFPTSSPPLPRLMTLLLEVYYERIDLQTQFPEVAEGDYSNLLKWVIDEGMINDLYMVILAPFDKDFEILLPKYSQ